MVSFHEMLGKITSSSYHNQMQQFVSPLKDLLGINHFWYYRITFTGHYSYLGTHSKWSEFCFDNAMLSHFPCLRHPNILKSGIQLMKASADNEYKKVLNDAWDKFNINFNINLQSVIPNGIEAFGFGTCYNDPHAEERLLNDLPLLKYFIKTFRKKHQKLFLLLEDNQVDLVSHFGPTFYERPKTLELPSKRDLLLKKVGLGHLLNLTQREMDVLKWISSGYPAPYIAKQLKLSKRTVENYIATIKSKLSCSTKVQLIQQAQDIASFGLFK